VGKSRCMERSAKSFFHDQFEGLLKIPAAAASNGVDGIDVSDDPSPPSALIVHSSQMRSIGSIPPRWKAKG